MSYVAPPPKHRAAHRAPKTGRLRRPALRLALGASTLAVVATGVAVGGSLALGDSDADVDITSASISGAGGSAGSDVAADGQDDVVAAPQDPVRLPVVTRSLPRTAGTPAADPLKQDSLTLGTDNALTRTEDLSGADPRSIARALLPEFGFGQDQFGCLDSLWTRESNWNPAADNPRSSAYGIPQALPGSKMSSAGPDWAHNPVTQIRWGLGYIAARYGTPCSAWGHSQSRGYY